MGNDLYAGGWFNSIGGIVATNIARWDGTNWSALGVGLDLGGLVQDMAVFENDLYVAGGFPMAGGMVVNQVAKWDGSTWSALGSGPNANGWPVQALAISSNSVYVGDYRGSIHKWDGAGWSTLPITTDSEIFCLAAVGGNLYIGAYFFPYSSFIAKWDGVSLSKLGSGVENIVTSLAISRNALYVVGDFKVAGGKASANVAKAHVSAAEGRFQDVTVSSVTGFSCTFTDGTVGYPYRIQTSSSLAPGVWVTARNFTYSRPVAITNASSTFGTKLFFRAVSP